MHPYEVVPWRGTILRVRLKYRAAEGVIQVLLRQLEVGGIVCLADAAQPDLTLISAIWSRACKGFLCPTWPRGFAA